MPAYQYKAIDGSGKSVTGRIEAHNDDDLELRLERMGLDLIKFKLASNRFSLRRDKVSRQDLVNFCFHMEQLTRAGVPIIDALIDLRDSMPQQGFRETVSAVIEGIEGGKTFSEALRDFPNVFEPVFVNLIAAGEQSGQLSEILHRLTESIKWQDELAAQTKKIVMYPLFVGTVILAVIVFLMVYLVPQLLSFIQSMGESIPVHTKVLIAVSSSITNYWHIYLATPIVLFVSIRYWARHSSNGRYTVDGWKLKLRPVGPIYKKIMLARFCSNFALMYKAGVTVLDCIAMGESLVNNKVLSSALQQVQRQISDGQSLTNAFKNSGLFPPLVVRMMRVGETSGALDDSLENVSYFYTRDIRESIERVQTMIEPTMTMVLGILLAWVMMSVLGPIYDLLGNIQ